MTEGGPPGGPFVVLLAGMLEPDQESALAAIEAALPAAEVVEASTLREASKALRGSDVGCALVGEGLLAYGTWGALADEFRRGAPHAALIALPEHGDVGEGWDDVVHPGDRDPRLLGRVLRSARAIATANERLTRWALRDPLTDVLNRRGLERVLVREISALERGQGPLTALLVDCDDFKRVNDLFGLPAGDRALRAISEALLGATRAGDTVARVGGDEFLVLLPQTRTWEAVEVAERIRQRVRDQVRLVDGTQISVSIGVRRLDEGATTVAEVMGATQAGLRLSKAGGKDQVRVVDPAAAGVAPVDGETSLPPGSRLHAFHAIEAFDVRTSVHGRWILRVALDAERRLELDAQRAQQSAWDLRWFHTAARELARPELPVHIRMFPMTVAEIPAERILERLPEGLPPSRVVLALDEQFLSGDPSALLAPLALLRDAGVGLCVEASDLGRSCLESLVLLRPDVVQVSASLVRGVGASRARRASLGRFVQVCDSLQVEVLAMGADLEADRLALERLGVRWAVGGAFSKTES